VSMFGLNSYTPSVFRKKLQQLADGLESNLDILFVHMPLSDLWNQGGGLDKTAVTAQEIAEALKDKGLRLVLLGDIHAYIETVVEGVRFVYPGSTEITASDEKRDKGALLVDITPDNLTIEQVPVKTRPFIDIDIETEEDLENILPQLKEAEDNKKPIALLTYSRELKGALNRISGIIGDNYMFRAMPAKSNLAISDASIELIDNVHSFDRDAAVKLLKKILSRDFATESDAPAIIMDMLDTPDKITKIAEEYVKSKGVKLKV